MIQSGNATLLQHFSKDYFAVDVKMSKYLRATLSNTIFCMLYIGNVNYRSLITVAFPIGSIGKMKHHVRIYNISAPVQSSANAYQSIYQHRRW